LLVGTVHSTVGTVRAPVVELGAPAAVPTEVEALVAVPTAAVEVEVLVAVPTEEEAPVLPVQAAAVPRAEGAAAIARSKNGLQVESCP
jgi:hypothetical protein